MAKSYWRKVLSGAWERTRKPLGWTKEKIVGAVALGVGTAIFTGFAGLWALAYGSLSIVVGVAVVAVFLFAWGIVETQAALFRESETDSSSRISEHQRQIEKFEQALEKERKAEPDYEMYRHLPKMSVGTAAQLWARQIPGLGIRGNAKGTWAMLSGAIQKGELPFQTDATIDPRMANAVMQRQREDPHPDLMVTRDALKAFARKHGYNPKFLRD